ncbi:hypothetical protein [Actinoplanes teichomyceticus]|uniref:Uncharacterized protein n=1 Tax=Actinoplanes teichomyceticus TaxID=1867 RepID=A0A561WIP3_ACTTI|nr:hypothetical protein [Actinoplanes teichomyceticus]TWG23741.1 hypothetical protein FHX34_102292 [Actinoplanes teichomyceticus]GIF11784.1 hypothetical protein Ate01nite_18160 [Actinoplanes teichomyceticus]
MGITFFRNDKNRRDYRVDSKRFVRIGSQLVSDIQGYAPDCINLLECIDEVAAGRAEYTEYEGNSAVFRCHPGGVTIESLGPVPDPATYTFEEARAVVLQYFDFLAPTREEKERNVVAWEQESGRPFAGRTGVIG